MKFHIIRYITTDSYIYSLLLLFHSIDLTNLVEVNKNTLKNSVFFVLNIHSLLITLYITQLCIAFLTLSIYIISIIVSMFFNFFFRY